MTVADGNLAGRARGGCSPDTAATPAEQRTIFLGREALTLTVRPLVGSCELRLQHPRLTVCGRGCRGSIRFFFSFSRIGIFSVKLV